MQSQAKYCCANNSFYSAIFHIACCLLLLLLLCRCCATAIFIAVAIATASAVVCCYYCCCVVTTLTAVRYTTHTHTQCTLAWQGVWVTTENMDCITPQLCVKLYCTLLPYKKNAWMLKLRTSATHMRGCVRAIKWDCMCMCVTLFFTFVCAQC